MESKVEKVKELREKMAIVKCDMRPDLIDMILNEIALIETGSKTCQLTQRDIAEYLKKLLDRREGPTWNCIIGNNFSANIRHIAGCYAYFYLEQVGYLIFKAVF